MVGISGELDRRAYPIVTGTLSELWPERLHIRRRPSPGQRSAAQSPRRRVLRPTGSGRNQAPSTEQARPAPSPQASSSTRPPEANPPTNPAQRRGGGAHTEQRALPRGPARARPAHTDRHRMPRCQNRWPHLLLPPTHRDRGARRVAQRKDDVHDHPARIRHELMAGHPVCASGPVVVCRPTTVRWQRRRRDRRRRREHA